MHCANLKLFNSILYSPDCGTTYGHVVDHVRDTYCIRQGAVDPDKYACSQQSQSCKLSKSCKLSQPTKGSALNVGNIGMTTVVSRFCKANICTIAGQCFNGLSAVAAAGVTKKHSHGSGGVLCRPPCMYASCFLPYRQVHTAACSMMGLIECCTDASNVKPPLPTKLDSITVQMVQYAPHPACQCTAHAALG